MCTVYPLRTTLVDEYRLLLSSSSIVRRRLQKVEVPRNRSGGSSN